MVPPVLARWASWACCGMLGMLSMVHVQRGFRTLGRLLLSSNDAGRSWGASVGLL